MIVGIIGRGTLGNAIASGLRASTFVESVDGTTRGSRSRNADVADRSDVLLLCVKPGDMEAAVASIVPSLHPGKVLVSTAASVASADVRRWSHDRARIVRAMPNTAAQARAAMTVIARSEGSCERAIETTRSLFDQVGRTLVMDERHLDAVTALSGCGPAFNFVVMEAMIEAGIALGIPYERARELVAQTALGAAALLLEGTEHPAQRKIDVATPGGRTIRGLLHLEERNVRAAISGAVLAAARPA